MEIISAREDEILAAAQAVEESLGETIEPSAAVAFAAARAFDLDGKRIGIISSGGNVTRL